MKYLEKTLHALILSTSIGFCSSIAFADSINGNVTDHYKTVINKTPYNVEVCENVSVSGDKTGDTLYGTRPWSTRQSFRIAISPTAFFPIRRSISWTRLAL